MNLIPEIRFRKTRLAHVRVISMPGDVINHNDDDEDNDLLVNNRTFSMFDSIEKVVISR